MLPRSIASSWILAFSFFFFFVLSESRVPQEEVDALQKIVTALGATYWKFNADSCTVEMVGLTSEAPMGSEGSVGCQCNSGNNATCNVITIVLKRYNLFGVLPAELQNLPHIQEIDLSYNYIQGTIPLGWFSTQLNKIALLANRLSGEIPKDLGNLTSLTYMDLESNQFSGAIPSELGKLTNLKILIFSSNRLSGSLPTSFSSLVNLTDLRVSGNNFSGPIPDYIQSWKQMTRLEMQATGFHGPIPETISLLNNLVELRITDITGPSQKFPPMSNMTGIRRMVLRNCSISSEIPAYVWQVIDLDMFNFGTILNKTNASMITCNIQIELDVSFNNLTGEIPDNISTKNYPKFIFLTGNRLSGNIPNSILKPGSNVDLSYNNFTWQDPEKHACQQDLNLEVNLFRSSSATNTLMNLLPCAKDLTCPTYKCSFRVNCGGSDLRVNEREGRVLYEGDAVVEGGTAKYYYRYSSYWGFSSTGDFMDDNNDLNTRFIANFPSTNLSEMYSTARLSPVTLTYFHHCLENENYTVSLHFAEIFFTNDNTYSSLGERIFDIYIQDSLVWKDFNMEEEAHGAAKPVIRQFNTTVTDNTLQIRFNWAGKGTSRIPHRGVYGPLISAISVTPTLKSCLDRKKTKLTIYIIIGAVGLIVICFIIGIVGFLWWKGYLQRRKRSKDFEGLLELQMVSFTLKQLKAATSNFDAKNKIGEGGFGPVYKGELHDGTPIAVKQLSSTSVQGNREFLNEIGMISCLQHPNLVKLHGCCIHGDQLMLVYEYLENNSLARSLFVSKDSSQIVLDWPTRFNISIGIARGLSFLHEESGLNIVHRDIKATNVLLDNDLIPKISDFGLAKLGEDGRTHISTRIAGTVGYMAPEYALWGYLTFKADVYSYGIVALEIVSGKKNNSYVPNTFIGLLDWACSMQRSKNFEELLDDRLTTDVSREEVERLVKVALLCTNASPSIRPTMSEVVRMLEGQMTIPDVIPEAFPYAEDVRFKATRGSQQGLQNESLPGSLTRKLATSQTVPDSCYTSNNDDVEINPGKRFQSDKT